MMRSLYAGVSGLKTHQLRMDVIGNNIANVNTVAYKSSSMTFSELMYQTSQSASGPNAATGLAGTNAKQIGLGVTSGAINTSITQAGANQTTGNPFDMKITGDSFFVVNNGSSNYFTRDGSFYVDSAGNLAMQSTGYKVMGWGLDENGDIKKDTVIPLAVMKAEYMEYKPEATSKAYFSGIVDKLDSDVTSTNGKTVNFSFYDKSGYKYTAKFAIKELGTTSSQGTRDYSAVLTDVLDESNNSVKNSYPNISLPTINYAYTSPTQFIKPATATVDAAAGGTNGVTLASGKINYASLFNGTIPTTDMDTLAAAYGKSTSDFMNSTLLDAGGTSTTIGALLLEASTGTAPNMAKLVDALNGTTGTITGIKTTVLNYNTSDGSFYGINNTSGTKTFTIDFDATYTNFTDITVDASNTSNVNNSGSSTLAAKSGDTSGDGTGRKAGKMEGIAVENSGLIYATYTNGQRRILGQIAVAEFANASGLEKEGENLYSATSNSGDFNGTGVDVTENGGKIVTGVLEMSNVDLSGQFTEMITTQRGFQANSRIITVSDTMLEELVNLKR